MSWRTIADKWPVLVGPVLILGAWELASRGGLLRQTFFPPPTRILARSTIVFDTDAGLAGDIWATVLRVLVVIALATLLGVGLGLLMTASQWTERGMSTVLAFFYPIPGVLFFPFLTFLLGRGETAVILTSVVTPFIVMALYTVAGVRTIQPVLLEAAKNYGSRGWRFFWRVLIPGALPSVVAGFKIALGFSLIAVVAVEMVGAQSGLGQFLWSNWQILRVMDMYVALLCVAVLGLLSSIGFDAVADRIIPWRTTVQEQRR
ncbi:ABC transporter permease [Egicoccus sp. AB-alg2]|uniref:ABC transporter permease n=1 Tax=Egicoccus sp. AB-alg2 TaxID=3242693 RepID=UPI00359D5DCC